MFYDRKAYTIHYGGAQYEILEPTNWKEDEKTLERHADYHGISVVISNDLIFTGEAKVLLESIVENEGPNARVRLVKEVKNPHTDIWEIDYEGF